MREELEASQDPKVLAVTPYPNPTSSLTLLSWVSVDVDLTVD